MEYVDKIGGYFIAAVMLAVMPLGIIIGALAFADFLEVAEVRWDLPGDLMSAAVTLIGLVAAVAVLVSAVGILWLGWRVIAGVRGTRQIATHDYAFKSDRSLSTSST